MSVEGLIRVAGSVVKQGKCTRAVREAIEEQQYSSQAKHSGVMLHFCLTKRPCQVLWGLNHLHMVCLHTKHCYIFRLCIITLHFAMLSSVSRFKQQELVLVVHQLQLCLLGLMSSQLPVLALPPVCIVLCLYGKIGQNKGPAIYMLAGNNGLMPTARVLCSHLYLLLSSVISSTGRTSKNLHIC